MSRIMIGALLGLFFVAFQLVSRGIPTYFEPDFNINFENKSFGCANHKHHSFDEIQDADETKIIRRNYNVLNYDLFMDWYKPLTAEMKLSINKTIDKIDTIYRPDNTIERYDTVFKIQEIRQINPEWNGVNKIKIRIDSANTQIVEFDAIDLRIDSLKINGELSESYQQQNGLLIVSLPEASDEGDEFVFDFYYTYIGKGSRGFWLVPEQLFVGVAHTGDSIRTDERLAYTMSEPKDARFWMPCNDAPHDKAYANISVRVPLPYTVGSNGLLTDSIKDGNSVTWVWKHNKPITTYLMMATSSIYKEYSDYYSSKSQNKDIELKYYIWEQDYLNTATDATQYNARHSFSGVPEMMELYEHYFGDYPYEKYGMVAIQPFNFGGMEHQTLSSINRAWLRGRSEGGIAHELVHQWIGNMITCATWNDIWINEGGATYGQALWTEKWQGYEGYLIEMWYNKYAYLRNPQHYNTPIYGIAVDNIFGSHAVLVYQKASWVYHMMREWYGADEFKLALQKLINEYAFQSIETKDFINFMEKEFENSPIPIKTFFDQWIYKAGHPVYSLEIIPQLGSDNNYNITLNLSQTQSGTNYPEKFVAPVTLIFYHNGNMERRTFINDQKSQTFDTKLEYLPDSVLIDDSKMLSTIENIIVSVKENTETSGLNQDVFPNPIRLADEGNIDLIIANTGKVTIQICSSIGEIIETVYDDVLPKGNFKFRFGTANLSPGAYFIKSNANDKNSFNKFIVIP